MKYGIITLVLLMVGLCFSSCSMSNNKAPDANDSKYADSHKMQLENNYNKSDEILDTEKQIKYSCLFAKAYHNESVRSAADKWCDQNKSWTCEYINERHGPSVLLTPSKTNHTFRSIELRNRYYLFSLSTLACSHEKACKILKELHGEPLKKDEDVRYPYYEWIIDGIRIYIMYESLQGSYILYEFINKD